MALIRATTSSSGGGTINPITKAWSGSLNSSTTVITLPFEPKVFICSHGTNGNNLWDKNLQYLFDVQENTTIYTEGYISDMSLSGTTLTLTTGTGGNGKTVDIYIS